MNQINIEKIAEVYSLYSRYCFFYHQNDSEKVRQMKDLIYKKLADIVSLNLLNFGTFEWTIKKMNQKNPIVDPYSYLFISPQQYLIHLDICSTNYNDFIKIALFFFFSFSDGFYFWQ